MNTNSAQKLFAALFSAGIAAFFIIGIRYPPPKLQDQDLRFDEAIVHDAQISSNLAQDIKSMWRTVPHKEMEVSPVSAINAANRVFGTVILIGKTTNEVFSLLGHNLKTKSAYKHGFWPVETNQIVYCFECGNFGWQFNLTCDPSGRVTEVERRWIH